MGGLLVSPTKLRNTAGLSYVVLLAHLIISFLFSAQTQGWGHQLPVTHVDLKMPSEHWFEG